MALASANARYDELHRDLPFHNGPETVWAKERSEQTPFHYRDGVSIWMATADLTPGDDFLGGGSPADEPEADHADSD